MHHHMWGLSYVAPLHIGAKVGNPIYGHWATGLFVGSCPHLETPLDFGHSIELEQIISSGT